MISAAINRVIELDAAVTELDFGGRKYTNKSVYPVKDPEPQCLALYTLTGFVDYAQADIDDLDWDRILIHVYNHHKVLLFSRLTESFLQRLEYVSADFSENGFSFGQWMDVESFIIKIQSQFVQDEATAEILKLVGNLRDENVRTVADDGVTQRVSAKASIARVQDVDVPNPVTLRPYRTFLEIEQPESQFVFRLRRGNSEGQMPTCALFEADGGYWKLVAIERIHDYLKEKLSDIAVIA